MTLNPSVEIQVQTSLSLLNTTGETIGMMIGTAQYGPTDEVVTCSNFNTVLSTFQEDRTDNTTITKAAELFFNNGGSILKIVRIADSNAAESELELDGAGAVSNVITIAAKYEGVYGDSFMIDIDAQGTGRIARVKVGDIIEIFDNNGDANGYASNALLAAAINAGSNYVTATSNNVALVEATSNYTQLASGDDGADGLASSDYTTAFDDLLIDEDWDLLMIPNSAQSSSIEETDAFHTTMTAKVVSRAGSYKKYGIYLSGVAKDETLATTQARTTAGERFVLAAPSIEHTSRVDGTTEYLDGTYLACALSGKIASFDNSAIALTRKVIAVDDLLVNETSGKKYYNNVEIEQFLNSRVCVVSNINNAIKVSRGVTRISDTTDIYFEINIVRIVDEIRKLTLEALDTYLGDPNTDFTRSRMQAICNSILQEKKDDNVLSDYSNANVSEGSSPDTVDVSFAVKPAFATNFINVLITVSNI